MDYFQAQFLLTLPVAGYYTVQIEASLLDNEGRVWHTGNHASMAVLVDSEENLRQHQRQREAAAATATKSGGSVGGHGGHSRNQ